jgi:hypothetical protein
MSLPAADSDVRHNVVQASSPLYIAVGTTIALLLMLLLFQDTTGIRSSYRVFEVVWILASVGAGWMLYLDLMQGLHEK